MKRIFHHSKRVIIAVVGGLIIVLGLVMVPYPGPGWLVVFAGLAILATEFDKAQLILDKAKDKYDLWQQWLGHQAFYIQALVWLMTFIIVVVTIWLLDGYGMLNDWFNLGQNWLWSPLPFFR